MVGPGPGVPGSVPGQVVSVVLCRTYILEVLKIWGQCTHIGRPQKSPLIYIQNLLNQEYSKDEDDLQLVKSPLIWVVNFVYIYSPCMCTLYRLINLSLSPSRHNHPNPLPLPFWWKTYFFSIFFYVFIMFIINKFGENFEENWYLFLLKYLEPKSWSEKVRLTAVNSALTPPVWKVP